MLDKEMFGMDGELDVDDKALNHISALLSEYEGAIDIPVDWDDLNVVYLHAIRLSEENEKLRCMAYSYPPNPPFAPDGRTWHQDYYLVEAQRDEAKAQRDKLMAAIKTHHMQKADDRCMMDDDMLYSAAGLPTCDRRVGNKASMLRNCERFINRRCESGGWANYQALESALKAILQLEGQCKCNSGGFCIWCIVSAALTPENTV